MSLAMGPGSRRDVQGQVLLVAVGLSRLSEQANRRVMASGRTQNGSCVVRPRVFRFDYVIDAAWSIEFVRLDRGHDRIKTKIRDVQVVESDGKQEATTYMQDSNSQGDGDIAQKRAVRAVDAPLRRGVPVGIARHPKRTRPDVSCRVHEEFVIGTAVLADGQPLDSASGVHGRPLDRTLYELARELHVRP